MSEPNRCCENVRNIYDKFVDGVFYLCWERRKRAIPDLDKNHAFLAESAVTLARRIKEKELKSEELMNACIARIKEVNPIINAVVDERYNDALAEAREVDKRIAAGLTEEEVRKQPFLGVPFTVKECQTVTGLCHTLGLLSRKDVRATEDAECVRLLREAGAIPVAVSNLPEFLFWQETRNMLFGQTNNPHHSGRTTGGSSGAEAALTASYATPISLCSDIGGSTRMPAFYCGVFGHNPTNGITSFKGMMGREGFEDSMGGLGFASKHAEDIAPLMKIIAGNRASELNLDREVNVKDIKFYYVESSNDIRCSVIRPELRQAMKNVIAKLTENATTTDYVPQPYYHEGLNHMYQLWRHGMTKEPENFAKWLKNNEGEATGIVELFKKFVWMSPHTIGAIFKLLDNQVLPQVNREWAEKLTKELRDDLLDKLGNNGVLLFPSAPQPAPYHYSCFMRPYNFAYWALFNVLRLPATQVPLGLNASGLPIGIQVVSGPNNDALCLSVAKYLEKEFGGFVAPCKIKK